jgi:hypothetical protein
MILLLLLLLLLSLLLLLLLLFYFILFYFYAGGEKPKDGRHVYANPLLPEICPILALAIYWLSFPRAATDERHIYPGASQEQRFRKSFKEFCEENKDFIRTEFGIDVSELGTHSIRKGSASFVASGSTSCPPITAIRIRAGWSTPGVDVTYLRFEAAGDQFVGRSVSGLPPLDERFAQMPPKFLSSLDPARISNVISQCFMTSETTPSNMLPIYKMCLASIVYHKDYLRRTFISSHPIFSNPLFSQGLVDTLSPYVVSEIAETSGIDRATGIPPHVISALKFEEIKKLVKEASSTTVEKIQAALFENSLPQTPATYGQVEAMVTRIQIELRNSIEQLRSNPPPPLNASSISSSSNPTSSEFVFPLYNWRGKMRRVQENFVIPLITTTLIWQAYWLGNRQSMFPPLRLLQGCDLNRAQQKRLSDLRFLMASIIDFLKMGTEIPNTLDRVNQLYHQALPYLVAIANRSNKIHIEENVELEEVKKRVDQLQWITLMSKLGRSNPVTSEELQKVGYDIEEDEFSVFLLLLS